MTRSIGAVAGALCLGLCAGWLAAAELAAQAPGATSETEQAIRKALDEKTDFNFVETPLGDVVEYIAKKHNIQIVLDMKSLDDAGLGVDVPVTRRLKGISLRSALRLTLKDLDLTWVIEDEVLQITTLDEAGQRLKPRVYDVTDLVEMDGQADYDTLIDTITTIVGPTMWDDVGGPASIVPFPLVKPAHAIVVSQTAEVHEQIAQLLADARRVRQSHADKKGKAADGAAAEAPADPSAVTVKVYKVNVPLRWQPRPAAANPPGAEKEADKKLSQFGGGGSAGTGTGTAVPNDRYLEELAKAIPDLISPAHWGGSTGGAIHALPAYSSGSGQLLVRQTAEVHSQVQRFLNDLQTKGGFDGGFGGAGGGFFYMSE